MSIDANLAAAKAERERLLAQFDRQNEINISCALKSGRSPTSIIRRADNITERKLIPLWPGVLWRGYPTILAGEAGLSKSTVSVDIAARLSRGDTWPGSHSKAKR
jgi:hypothetical protein